MAKTRRAPKSPAPVRTALEFDRTHALGVGHALGHAYIAWAFGTLPEPCTSRDCREAASRAGMAAGLVWPRGVLVWPLGVHTHMLR